MRLTRDVRVGDIKLSVEIFTLDGESHSRMSKYPMLAQNCASILQGELTKFAKELNLLESDTVLP